MLLSAADDGVIRIGCNLIHDGVKEAKYSKANQIHNGGKKDVIHCKQHKNLGDERKRKYKMNTCKDKWQEKHRKHL